MSEVGAVAPVDVESTCNPDRAGGTLTMGEYTPLPSFQPGQGSHGVRGGAASAAVYDRLMRLDPATGEYEPQMAEALTPNDDFTEWTLELRPGVTFTNGDALTAEAVKFTLDMHRDPARRSLDATVADNIASMEVVDPTTLAITLKSSWPTFPYLLASSAGEVVNPAVFTSMSAEEFAKNPVGASAGPFVVQRNSPGEELVLAPNPTYYGGPACVTLRFVTVPGAQATLEAFRAGELQAAFLRDPQVVDAAKAEGLRGYSSIVNSGGIVVNNGFGGYTGPGTDVRVRRAIAASIDPDLVNKRLFDGKGDTGSALISEHSTLYSGAQGPDYDPDAARALIEEVKAETGWDGTIGLLFGNTPEGTEQGILIEAMLEAAGFTVEPTSAPNGQIITRGMKGDYEISVGGISITDAQPWAGLASGLHSGGGTNWTGAAIPALDTEVDALLGAETLDERKAVLARIQEIVNDQAPLVSFNSFEEFVAIAPVARGIRPTVNSTMLFDKAYLEN